MKLLGLKIDPITQNGDPINVKPPGGLPSGGFGPSKDSLGNHLVQWFFVAVFIIAALLALFYFIYGGIQWITSGGDKTKVQAARNKMVYSVIGLIIVFLAFFIVTLIGSLFHVTFF